MSGRVRAAGRNLTVGELREALDDLDDAGIVGVASEDELTEWRPLTAASVLGDLVLIIPAEPRYTTCADCGSEVMS